MFPIFKSDIMKQLFLFLSFLCFYWVSQGQNTSKSQNAQKSFSIVIHGGAGYMNPETMSEAEQAAYHKKLHEALSLGKQMLEEGESAVNTVEKVINIFEDSPLFNAGKGAVFTNVGTCELDASIMDGKTKKAGAVAGVAHVKNPISAAVLVMNKSPHVLLAGSGADKFAEENGLQPVENSYFYTEDRRKALERAKKSNAEKHGTVGCVVLDTYGNIAAGTSTGGMTNKRYGRVGDSPIIGAGTYADNDFGGISATGAGEYFIRLAVAYDIIAQMHYQGISMQEAAENTVLKKLPDLGGRGGIIGLDAEGNVVYVFTTDGMFRGSYRSGGKIETAIFKQ